MSSWLRLKLLNAQIFFSPNYNSRSKNSHAPFVLCQKKNGENNVIICETVLEVAWIKSILSITWTRWYLLLASESTFTAQVRTPLAVTSHPPFPHSNRIYKANRRLSANYKMEQIILVDMKNEKVSQLHWISQNFWHNHRWEDRLSDWFQHSLTVLQWLFMTVNTVK